MRTRVLSLLCARASVVRVRRTRACACMFTCGRVRACVCACVSCTHVRVRAYVCTLCGKGKQYPGRPGRRSIDPNVGARRPTDSENRLREPEMLLRSALTALRRWSWSGSARPHVKPVFKILTFSYRTPNIPKQIPDKSTYYSKIMKSQQWFLPLYDNSTLVKHFAFVGPQCPSPKIIILRK